MPEKIYDITDLHQLSHRWTSAKKAAVVKAYLSHTTTAAELYELYNITQEELDAWIKLYKAEGQRALRSTRIQDYRNKIKSYRRRGNRL